MAKKLEPQYVREKGWPSAGIRLKPSPRLTGAARRAQERWIARQEAAAVNFLEGLDRDLDAMRAAGAPAEEIEAYRVRANAECTLDEGILDTVGYNRAVKNAPLET
jgi:hypothetical protein